MANILFLHGVSPIIVLNILRVTQAIFLAVAAAAAVGRPAVHAWHGVAVLFGKRVISSTDWLSLADCRLPDKPYRGQLSSLAFPPPVERIAMGDKGAEGRVIISIVVYTTGKEI